jgi:hypothetical protein
MKVFYAIQTENGRFKTTARNGVAAWLFAFGLGWRSYFDLNPQRVVVTKWVSRP